MVFVSCLIFVTTRLRSCEAASELLMSYRNGHEVEKKELNDLENGLRFQKIEDLGPSEAELELERLRVRIPSIYPHTYTYICMLSLAILLPLPISWLYRYISIFVAPPTESFCEYILLTSIITNWLSTSECKI